MQVRQVDFRYHKLYVSLVNLKLNDKRRIKKELDQFKSICSNCFTLNNAMGEMYNLMYELQLKNEGIELPTLFKFFSDIRNFSQEAYEFITEGYDILNLKNILACENMSVTETFNVIWGIHEYSKYISYAIVKLLDEENLEKQYIMLRGLTGTV